MKPKRLIRKIIEKMFHLAGYDIILGKYGVREFVGFDKNDWEPFFHKDEKVTLYKEAVDATNMWQNDNLMRELRRHTLQQSLQHVLSQNISGDIVECGCYKGLSTYLISKYLQASEGSRHLHIFDSFEGGLSDKDKEDQNNRFSLSEEDIKQEKEIYASTRQEVEKVLNGFNDYTIYEGWIPSRFEEIKDKKFALIYVDVDLYQPTKDSIDFLFPRLNKGGILVCDDYNSSQFPGAKKAIDEYLKNNSEVSFFYEIPMGGCFIIK